LPVNATAITFRILEGVARSGPVGVSELARRLDIPKSTAYDHLRTLTAIGYISATDDGYRLNSRPLDLGAQWRNNLDLYEVAKPELQKLAKEAEMHVSLMVQEEGHGVTLYTASWNSEVELIAHPGMRTHIHTTSGGKAMLAELPESRVDEIIDKRGLEQLTTYTITDRKELHQELDNIHRQGFALNRQERIDGLRGVGAAVTDRDDEVVGALVVYGPASYIGGKWFEDYQGGNEDLPDRILHTANVVEVNLSYS
jgi:DNA-binding IclR family transcriptional regulator